MRRLFLISTTTLLAFLLLVPPAWAEWIWPLRGEVITPYRNGSDPYASGQHRGIDIAGAPGATVVAAVSGEVRFAGTAGSSGLTVSMRTGQYDTSYLHLSSTVVRKGDRVAAGQRLGTVGTTGTRSAAAPHLHFGVRDAGSRHAYHDPLGFLPPPTATQPPRGAPAPQPSPVPVGPAPVPVHAPAGSPRQVPAGAPRRVPVPAPSPVRVPAGAPRHAPAGVPRGVPLPAPTPGHVPASAPAAPPPVPAATPGPLSAGAPGLFEASRRAPGSHEAPAAASGQSGAPANTSADETSQRTGPADLVASHNAAPAPTRVPADDQLHSEPASPPGPDLGLLLACLGLVGAASLLGLTRDGQKATRATRHRIARVLHPMLGRR